MSSSNQTTKFTSEQVQETSTIAVNEKYILASNGMKFALNPTTPAPAKDLQYAFTHVDGMGVKTTTVFEKPVVGTDHVQKVEKPKSKLVEKKGPSGGTNHDQEVHPNEKVLVLKKRGGGYKGRGGTGGVRH
jgi:hypothetical protein